MNTINKIILFVIIFLLSNLLAGQEVIMNMSSNPVLEKMSENVRSKSVSNDTLLLPFFDDFAYKDSYPSQLYWQDNYAYINNDYAYYPVSYGVATLDAIDENGRIHSNLHSGIKGVADYLTSRPIRLDSIFGNENRPLHDYDSVYLSFFFQPNYWDNVYASSDGLTGDSLVVEFYSPVYEEWFHVWSTIRFPFDSIKPEENNGRQFIEVIIPITDEERYFHKGFQFRFKNYVTLTENNYYPNWQVNGSQWNIDYVYLDRDRRFNSFYKDICFVSDAHSFLSSYYSMPYNQYSANSFDEIIDFDNVLISNLDQTANNVGYDYEVINSKGTVLKHYLGGSGVINPFHISGYYDNPSLPPPVFPFSFPVGVTDSAEFLIKHYITSDLDFKQNDTITFEQKFHNYYAYDNGSPEYSYTLRSPGNVQVAVRFKLNTADTLRAVKIFFNDIAGTASELYYNLRVWNESDRKPYSLVYEQGIVVKNDNSSTNNFITIMLDEPVIIRQNDFPFLVFYVGIEKTASEAMALGFDISRDNSFNTYQNTTGQWIESIFAGSIMIRPVLGKKFKVSSIDDYSKNELCVYPNPVINGTVNIKSETEFNKIYIYNNFGTKVFESGNLKANDISIPLINLRNGLYLVVIIDKTGKKHTEKIIFMQ
ncbi:MAG: T9SS type A sorting domain-containing protein [Bacteroidales bacterium]|jgi:hypothetical protein|nr:T9SS type A sorting domain-containing protein [Bacteroidales bacterium]